MFLAALLALAPLQDSMAPDPGIVVDGFRYNPGIQSVGTLYRYKKSNIDGSNPSHVDLYVASETHIESFKFHTGYPQATLVVADMDWNCFSVKHFETTKIHADDTITPVGKLDLKGRKLVASFGKLQMETPVDLFPWHTYDFDLASLNVSLRYLSDPEGVVLLGMIEPVLGKLVNKGFAELAYLDDEKRGGQDCRHYSIDGPGFNDRGGELWVSKGSAPVIVDYEIDLPDESSMRSGKMLLVETKKLTLDQWKQHKLDALK